MDYTTLKLKPLYTPIKITNKTGDFSPVDISDHEHVLYWIQDETSEYIYQDFVEYLDETYKLICYYGGTDCLDIDGVTMETETLAKYCAKYGAPFGNGKNKVRIFDLVHLFFDNMKMIVDVFRKDETNTEYIDVICNELINAINYEKSKGKDTDYRFIRIFSKTDSCKDFDSYVCEDRDGISTLAYDCTNNEYYSNITVPIAKIRCNSGDIPLLSAGTYNEKSHFIKNRIFENLSELIAKNPPQFKMVINNDVAEVEAYTDNHVICFLLAYLSNDRFHICKQCGKLLTNGNKWCNPKHMDAYQKKTPVNRMKNMVGKWDILSPVQRDELIKEGEKLLKQFTYEIVKKQLISMKKEILK
jgi:hypothetical protein